jgi:hypothetical protein
MTCIKPATHATTITPSKMTPIRIGTGSTASALAGAGTNTDIASTPKNTIIVTINTAWNQTGMLPPTFANKKLTRAIASRITIIAVIAGSHAISPCLILSSIFLLLAMPLYRHKPSTTFSE